MSAELVSRTHPLILLASGDHDLLNTLGELLHRDGFRITTTHIVADCLAIAHQSPPDLVLLDDTLTDGDSLLGVLARLSRHGTFPVVVLTARDEPEMIDALLMVGAADIMTRPLHWKLLQARMARMVSDQSIRARAEAAAADQRALVDALRSTAAAMLDSLDLDTVLDAILHAVQRVVPSEAAHVILIEPDGGFGQITRSHGQLAQPAYWNEVQTYRLNIDDIRNLREMRISGQAFAIMDTQTYPGWVNFPIARWIRSHVAAPIRVSGVVMGFLTLESSTPGTFTSEDAAQLQILADQAGIALRNVHLYDEVKRQAAELEERVQIRTLELQRQREQLRAILDAMTEGVAYIDLRDTDAPAIGYINPAFTQISGWTLREIERIGLQVFRPKDADDASFEAQQRQMYTQLRESGLAQYETLMTHKNGEAYDAAGVLSRINDVRGRMVGAVLVLRDVSQQKQLEMQKARFVSHASHELRTPLTNLKTRLYLIRKQPDQMFQHLRVMEDVTDRMKRLVEDLLDMTRFERGGINISRRITRLQDLLYDSVMVQQPEAERKGLMLRHEITAVPIHLDVDPERLVQVITNLLTNAINYTPAGGTITVRAIAQPMSPGGAGSRRSPAMALVQVEDDGVGIAPEHLANIFQPFYRVMTQVRGTGLGLSIAREIIELHDGQLGVESEVGRGSRFTIALPIAAQEGEMLDDDMTQNDETDFIEDDTHFIATDDTDTAPIA